MIIAMVFAAIVGMSASAVAAVPGPGWVVSSLAEPSIFSPAHSESCTHEQFESTDSCDRYTLFIRNAGSMPATETVTIADTLPAGVTPLAIFGTERESGPAGAMTCTTLPLQCSYVPPERGVAPGGVFVVTINVSVSAGGPLAGNLVTVSGGGAPTVATRGAPTPVGSGPTPFYLDRFAIEANAVDGTPDTQAGDHPDSLTTSFHIAGVLRPPDNTGVVPVQQLRDLAVDLPVGLVGDPEATPKCPLVDLTQPNGQATCPPDSEVGIITFEGEGSYRSSKTESNGQISNSETSGIYNLQPEAGYPAEFGFNYIGHTLVMYASAVPTEDGYVLRVTVPGVPRVVELNGATLTFFGDPGRQNGTASSPDAFFSNPVNCATGAPLRARIAVDTWENPGHWVEDTATAFEHSAIEPVGGCNMLLFQPQLRFAPDSTQADEPSGYTVELTVPQSPNFTPDLATPELKNVEVALPSGLAVSPAAAPGLVGCQTEGSEGFGLGATSPVEDQFPGSPLVTPTPGHCPARSQIGTVEIETPLLPPRSLNGHLYLAQPRCGGAGQAACTETSASNGELFGVYLEAQGAGVVIKLRGGVSVNPTTGQITVTFRENPQLPFSRVTVHLDGGPQAPLANPQSCRAFAATADMTPWSAPVTPDAVLATPAYLVGGCLSPSAFAPSFNAGSVNAVSGTSSPFSLTIVRRDREQDLSTITVRTPPGLVGMISQVPLCGEAQAAAGTCREASRIGTTNVASGSGPDPLWLSGRVYLTGPYGGAPFGLSVVVPAVAGPFNLGDVVVRSAIKIDRDTSALTVTTGALPQIKDGVPFRLQTVNVAIDRPGFMLNPTNCEQQSVTGTIGAAQGATASVSSPFAVGGCAGLPFKPSFTVFTQAKTSKANGASLVVKISQKPGEANIHKVDLQLPLALPSRLTTLQKACAEAQFDANPAGCPAGSVIGTAKAVTPVLQAPLTGPAYLVSHGGAAFPDVEYVLQADERGGEVEIVLDGKTQIKKGITYSHFETVPDAPISSFETNLPEGPHSVLAAFGNLCAQNLVMPTTLVGQNGAQIKQSTRIAVTRCRPVTISKRKLSGRSVILAFTLTAKGTVTVTGLGLKRYRKTLGAGSHQVKVALSKAGLSLHRQHRKIRIKVVLRSGKNTSSTTTTLKL
jgi:hypothetical protein